MWSLLAAPHRFYRSSPLSTALCQAPRSDSKVDRGFSRQARALIDKGDVEGRCRQLRSMQANCGVPGMGHGF